MLYQNLDLKINAKLFESKREINELLNTENQFNKDLNITLSIYEKSNIPKEKYKFLNEFIHFSESIIETVQEIIKQIDVSDENSLKRLFDKLTIVFEELTKKIENVNNLGYLIEPQPGVMLTYAFTEGKDFNYKTCDEYQEIEDIKQEQNVMDNISGLNSLAIKITQRIMKYQLLFKQIQKKCNSQIIKEILQGLCT